MSTPVDNIQRVSNVQAYVNAKMTIDGWWVEVDPSRNVDLQPTTYCTAMWNGTRCTGKHDIEWPAGVSPGEEVIHSDDCTRSWRQGWGGITADMPFAFECDGPDYELNWSALDTLGPLEAEHTVYPNWRYSTGEYRLPD